MSESQKETFRKYLEQAGAIDVLVKGTWTGHPAFTRLVNHQLVHPASQRKFQFALSDE